MPKYFIKSMKLCGSIRAILSGALVGIRESQWILHGYSYDMHFFSARQRACMKLLACSSPSLQILDDIIPWKSERGLIMQPMEV